MIYIPFGSLLPADSRRECTETFPEYESILRPLSVYITALLYSELSCGFLLVPKIVFSGKIVPLNSIAPISTASAYTAPPWYPLFSAINELLSSR
jgi:hypothetical protein